MAPLTRLSKTVAGTQNFHHWFRHALTTMWAQPRGPVHLSLTHDAMTGECDAPTTSRSAAYFAGAAAPEPAIKRRPRSIFWRASEERADRHPGRRRRRARRSRRAAAGNRRALVDPGRDDAARQGRVPGGPRAFARRVRLCRHAPCHQRHPRRRPRLPAGARLGLQRARHHALDGARAAARRS